MKYLTFIRHSESYRESGPPQALMEAMGRFVDRSLTNGTLVDTGGLLPSREGARVRLAKGKITVIDGPFTETKELVSGFWIWQVRSMEEAVEWLKRCPNPHCEDSEVELRPLFEAADFGENLTPEVREREQRLRHELAKK